MGLDIHTIFQFQSIGKMLKKKLKKYTLFISYSKYFICYESYIKWAVNG